MRILIIQERLGGRFEAKYSAQDSKGLQNCPRVGMQLDRGNIENPKDSHSKIVEGKTYVQVRKKRTIHKKEVVRRILPTMTYTVDYAANIHDQCFGRTVRF